VEIRNMDHFEEAFARTMSEEGGYSFDRMDPGGETYMGISRVYWPGWEGWGIIDDSVEEGIILEFATADLAPLIFDFYRTNFWYRMQGDKVVALSPKVAYELFDTAVNLDVPDAVKFLQVALNMQRMATRAFSELIVDGLLGPNTLTALARYLATQPGDPEQNEKILLNCMNGEQYLCYKGNPRHTYFRGWFLRV
jgi:lysozyme family protein